MGVDLKKPFSGTVDLSDSEKAAWIDRLGVVGRAQARYLWLLLATGIFYLAVHVRVASGEGNAPNELTLPIVDMPLSAIPVWSSGPLVLAVLVLAVHGALRAYGTAASKLGVRAFGVGEEYDLAPNTLDFVVYTTSESPKWLRGVLLLAYPLYFALFCVEAWWILIAVYRARPPELIWVLWALGGVLAAIATWRSFLYLWNNGARAWRLLRGGEEV